jgi:hypothetical protein
MRALVGSAGCPRLTPRCSMRQSSHRSIHLVLKRREFVLFIFELVDELVAAFQLLRKVVPSILEQSERLVLLRVARQGERAVQGQRR